MPYIVILIFILLTYKMSMDCYAVSLMKKYHKRPFLPFREKVKILSPFTRSREREALLAKHFQPIAVYNKRFFKVYQYTLKIERLVFWTLFIFFLVLIIMTMSIYMSKII